MPENTRKSLRPVLVVSLALNMLLIGLLAALFLAGPDSGLPSLRHPPAGPLGAALNPHRLRQVLPESARPVLDATLAEHEPGIRAHVDALMAARRETAEVIAAEPFDRERLQTVLARLLVLEDAVSASAQAMIVDLLGRLSPADRATVAGLAQPPAPPREERQR